MSEEIEEIKKELPPEKSETELLQEQLGETKNRLLRALADFDNYKKWTLLNQEQTIKLANADLIKELLLIFDGYSIAEDVIKKEKNPPLSKLRDTLIGVGLLNQRKDEVLNKFGLKEIEADGKLYDPNFHAAFTLEESDKPAGTIIKVVQKGYTLHGRVIRPSMVIVSKKK